MATTPPSLSIVTAVMNRRTLVQHALDSFVAQDVEPERVEHIVIDGGSTDGTLDVLKRYPHIRLVSEPDSGVYDAMNKGIRMARGEVIGLLNSDDRLPSGALHRVLAAVRREADIIMGSTKMVDGTRPERPVMRRQRPSEGSLRLFDLTRGVARINAMFLRRSLFDRLGYFDESFRVAADREWLLRAYLARLRVAPVSEPVYEYTHHPGSLTDGGQNDQLMRDENLLICQRYLERRDLPRELTWELRTWQAHIKAGRVFHRTDYEGPLDALRQAGLSPRDTPWLARAAVERALRRS